MAQKQTSLLPAFVGSLFRSANNICETVEFATLTLRDGAEGIHEISTIMINSQKQAMLANLAEA